MKRTSLVIAAALAISGFASLPAFASETAASCTTTYTSAMQSDVLINGPVHFGAGGSVSVGPFTPSVFVNGAQAPTTAYVACL